MDLKPLDLNVLTTLCSDLLYQVTCLECCRYYVAPTTATCGHTLCRGCWYGRRQCPICASPVERKPFQLDLPLQKSTEHVHLLVEAFEKVFNINLDEFELEIPNAATQEDLDNNIEDFLPNSQNLFSAPTISQSSKDLNPSVKYLKSKVQIHPTNVKMKSPTKVLHIQLPQDDWDKIEAFPDEKQCVTKDQLNVLEPMLKETLKNDDKEYSTRKPSRSTRNTESTSNSSKESNEIQNEMTNTKSSIIMPLKPSKNIKQTWNKGKKIKEKCFEMCEKTYISNIIAKQHVEEILPPDIVEDFTPIALTTNKEVEQHDINKEKVLQKFKQCQSSPKTVSVDLNEKPIQETYKINYKKLTIHRLPPIIIQNQNLNIVDIENCINKNITKKSNVRFIKKGALQMNTKENMQTSDNKHFTSSTANIQILIKIDTPITNIKNKAGNIQFKVNTDQEIQTSLETQNFINNKDNNSLNININFGENGPICKITRANTQSMNKATQQNSPHKENIPEGMDYINDLDIFDYEMSNTSNVKFKFTQKLPSKILVPTQNKNKRNMVENASECLNNSNNLPRNKKPKVFSNEETTLEQNNFKVAVNDSECNNHNQVMGKVFASIDRDMETVNKDNNWSKLDNDRNAPRSHSEFKANTHEIDNQKYSENIFSIMDADESKLTKKVNAQVVKPALHTVESFTPNLCQEFTSVLEEEEETGDVDLIELGTPFNDDSDKSVDEETPQKNVSITKIKQKSSTSYQTDGNLNINHGRPTLETPPKIIRFVDQIRHVQESTTPVTRKSLSFNHQSVDDNNPEKTLCPSSIVVAKTTQEKEFMNELEENSESPMCNVINEKHSNKFCIAGSCLKSVELAKLKLLCKEKGWSYLEKYTNDITHLVVGVDEENKSQRSVKYICALAAGKWIISYAWVEKCYQSRTVVPEEPFETLDMTGEPGPRRSRLARKKLFEGISFYCMQPFSVLDVDILKNILEAAGGRVVNDTSEVRVQNEKPALLLAEPEDTQEDKFINLAMELCVVPVNYEWVLNCLGSYTLGSIHEMLLCPSTLLPPETSKWPHELIVHDFD